jgi:hypothetical protein
MAANIKEGENTNLKILHNISCPLEVDITEK